MKISTEIVLKAMDWVDNKVANFFKKTNKSTVRRNETVNKNENKSNDEDDKNDGNYNKNSNSINNVVAGEKTIGSKNENINISCSQDYTGQYSVLFSTKIEEIAQVSCICLMHIYVFHICC